MTVSGLKNSSLSQSKMFVIHSNGGGNIVRLSPICQPCCSTILVFLVSQNNLVEVYYLCLISIILLAMSTTVEHMFSQGWLLLDRVEELPGNQVGTGLNPSTMNDAEQATQS